MSDDLCRLSAAEAGALIAKGALSPYELTLAVLHRIERIDPLLHAYVVVTRDRALTDARRAEHEIRDGRRRGPLHGVPIALKDVIDTSGIPTTGCSRVFQDRIPGRDAAVAARLRDAGTILLGKLTCHELAHGGPSFDLPWPPARNPWDTTRYTGGSSSGAGAAVAAGLCFGAIGTDTGGSIRSPAALCGVVGLKPTHGRVSLRGIMPNSYSLDHAGPLAGNVRDAALLLGAVAGFDPDDPASVDKPVTDWAAAIGRPIRGFRIGVVRHFHETDAKVSPASVASLEAALDVLAGLGAKIIEVRLSPLEDYAACKTLISMPELHAAYEPELKTRLAEFGENFRFRVLAAPTIAAIDHVQAHRWRRRLSREMLKVFERVDVLATAGNTGPAPLIETIRTSLEKPSLPAPFNVTGCPALTMCSGFTPEGLPLAIQLAATPFDEATLLAAAHAYEQATPEHRRRPEFSRLPEEVV